MISISLVFSICDSLTKLARQHASQDLTASFQYYDRDGSRPAMFEVRTLPSPEVGSSSHLEGWRDELYINILEVPTYNARPPTNSGIKSYKVPSLFLCLFPRHVNILHKYCMRSYRCVSFRKLGIPKSALFHGLLQNENYQVQRLPCILIDTHMEVRLHKTTLPGLGMHVYDACINETGIVRLNRGWQGQMFATTAV